MVCNGYSSLTAPQLSDKDMKIQKMIDELLGECVSNLEMEYGVIIDLQYSWDYMGE